MLHSFAVKLPKGAHDIAYKDYGAYQGDEATIRFTVTRQGLAQFMSTLRTGTNDPVTLQKSGIRWFDADADADDAKAAGRHLGKETRYSSAQGFAGAEGSYYGGQLSILVDESKAPRTSWSISRR